jgi:hypothetical protein
MRGAILPLPQYAFMAWRSVKTQGHLYLSCTLEGTSSLFTYVKFCTLKFNFSSLVSLMETSINPFEN